MSTLTEWLVRWKQKKQSAAGFILSLRANHPHRMSGASLGGAMNLVIDQREFSSEPYTAYVWTWDLDFSAFPSYTRKFVEVHKFWKSGSNAVAHALADEYEFCLYQPEIGKRWRMQKERGGSFLTEEVNVGTLTTETYTKTGEGDAYELQDTETTDVLVRFQWAIVGTAGDPVSGGNDGSSGVLVEVNLDIPGMGDTFGPPDLDDDVSEERMPWNNSWADVDISAGFGPYLTAKNATWGGGFSGSCSIALSFS